MSDNAALKKELGPVLLWALGVGYVISGMYFGWNLGLPEAGPYGFLAATVIATFLYVSLVASYAELACALPRAGGAFVYAHQALGPSLGLVCGLAQWIEFVFAPPAIAAAIGAYVHVFVPGLSPTAAAMIAYIAITALNIFGVKQSATFELGVTVLAVVELLVFIAVAAFVGPGFRLETFARNPLPHGWAGTFAALPYALWFYLGIEGVANLAEESVNPQRDLPRGLNLAMGTLVVLALCTFFAAVGVDGWESVVYKPGTTELSDSPLPLALAHVVGEGTVFYHMLVTIGIFGLVASFHGILITAGRCTFEFGRVGYAPRGLGRTLRGRDTPAAALVTNMFLGFAALLTGRTGEIITLSVFGALTMYALSMVSLFRLRQTAPHLLRPYRAPGYPFVPATALVLSVVCLAAMVMTQTRIAIYYASAMLVGFIYFRLVIQPNVRETPFPLPAQHHVTTPSKD